MGDFWYFFFSNFNGFFCLIWGSSRYAVLHAYMEAHTFQIIKKIFLKLASGVILKNALDFQIEHYSFKSWFGKLDTLGIRRLFQIWTNLKAKISLETKFEIMSNVRFISYSKCSNWHQISKLLSNFGCLFTCYFDRANSIETNLQTCNLHTIQYISYKSIK